MKVKGVIVAAGYGTRLLPVTRVVPKELLPLVDRPAIDWIAEEFQEAGIEDVLLITSRRKRALEDWFDRDPELEGLLGARVAPRPLRVHTIRQARMGGTGDALRLVSAFAGADPVVVAYPDDLFLGENATTQLITAWRSTGCTVLSAANLVGQDVSRYGVLDAEATETVFPVRGIVEKPAPGAEPSHLVSLGRYLYTADFFPALERHAQVHVGGEYHPMLAMTELAYAGRLRGTVLRSTRLDTGTALGYSMAFVEEALRRPELAEPMRRWLHSVLDREPPPR